MSEAGSITTRAALETGPRPANLSVAHAIDAALARHGVEHLIGMCSPIAIHFHAPSFGIRQIGMRTENAGAMIADGYARVSRKVGVVGAMGGPGAALLVPGLAEAMNASVPVVALVEDCAIADTDKNADEDLDPFALFASCAKWIRRVTQADRIDDYVDMAFRAAASGRPGPAVLCVPRDLEFSTASIPASPARRASLGEVPLFRSVADPAAVEEAARLIAEAERPVVIAGGGVHLSGAHYELAALQERAHLPVATTYQGKGTVDERHPLSIGVVGYALGKLARAYHLRDMIETADLLLLVGNRTNEKSTASWTLLPRNATCIHIDIDPEEIGRNYEALGLVGDAGLTLAALTEALGRRDLDKRLSRRAAVEERIAGGRRTHRADIAEAAGSDATPILPHRLMAELDRVLTPEAVVVADASFATVWMANYLTAQRRGMRFLSPRGLGGLGWGFPAALGAKLAAGERPVFAICGDGGFGHMWVELETAARLGINVVLIVLNNQQLSYQVLVEDRLFGGGHSPGANFRAVDHAAVARAAGCLGIRVESPAAIRPALDEALAADGPVLLDVVTDGVVAPPVGGLDD